MVILSPILRLGPLLSHARVIRCAVGLGLVCQYSALHPRNPSTQSLGIGMEVRVNLRCLVLGAYSNTSSLVPVLVPTLARDSPCLFAERHRVNNATVLNSDLWICVASRSAIILDFVPPVSDPGLSSSCLSVWSDDGYGSHGSSSSRPAPPPPLLLPLRPSAGTRPFPLLYAGVTFALGFRRSLPALYIFSAPSILGAVNWPGISTAFPTFTPLLVISGKSQSTPVLSLLLWLRHWYLAPASPYPFARFVALVCIGRLK